MQCHICPNTAQFIEAIPNGLLFCSKACQLIEVQTRRPRNEKTQLEYGDKKKTKSEEEEEVEYTNSIIFLNVNKLQEIEFPVNDRKYLSLKKVDPSNDNFPGLGVAAIRDIPEGTVIGYYAGYYKHTNLCKDNEHTFKLSGLEMVVDASAKGNLTRYISHNYLNPNVEAFEMFLRKKYKVIGFMTLRDIKEGEMIEFKKGEILPRNFTIVDKMHPIRANTKRINIVNDMKFTCLIDGRNFEVGVYSIPTRPGRGIFFYTLNGEGKVRIRHEENPITAFQSIVTKLIVHVLLSRDIIVFESNGRLEPFSISRFGKPYVMFVAALGDTKIKVFE